MAKAALISAVPPLMLKTAANPSGLPKEVFDEFQATYAANRAQFYYDLQARFVLWLQTGGMKHFEPVIWNWWRQGIMGGAKAHYDGIVAFSRPTSPRTEEDQCPRFWSCTARTIRSPYVAAGPLSAKLLKHGTLKTYKDFPHGMPTTQAETINADLLAFLKG